MHQQQQLVRQGFEGTIVRQLVPVKINGKEVRIDPDSISPESWKPLHGSFKGQEVHSPEICTIGESVLLRPDGNRSFVASFDRAALGVTATRYLQSEGINVQA